MKRLLSGFLAAVLCVCLSSVAFAAETSATLSSANGDESITFSNSYSFKESGTLTINSQPWIPGSAEKATLTIYHFPSGTKISAITTKSATGLNGSVYMPNFDKSAYETMGGGGIQVGDDLTGDDLVFYHFSDESHVVITTNKNAFFTGSSTSTHKQEPKKQDAQAPATTNHKPTHSRSTDISYKVKMGDTFGVLALNYFGDMTYWPAIYNYNAEAIGAAPGKQIYEGMELAIPGAIQHGDEIINVIAPAVAGNGEKLYTVQAGDTYGTIALAHFGDMSRYQEIFNRNSDRLKDINTLYAGQIIVLPEK